MRTSTASNINISAIERVPTSPSLNEEDDITESPLLKAPLERWIESQNRQLSVALLEKRYINCIVPIPHSVQSNLICTFKTSLADCSEAFGSKINSENIPGTPMEPDHNHNTSADAKSYETTTTNHTSILNEISAQRRRSSPQPPIDHQSPPLSLLNRPETPLKNILAQSPPQQQQPPPSLTSSKITNNNYANDIGGGSGSFNPIDGSGEYKRGSVATEDSENPSCKHNAEHRSSKQDKEGLDPDSLMFRDGRRKIDMILCFEEENEGVMTELEAKKRDARRNFMDNLVKEGLELETEDKLQAFDEKTYFVKVHMPWKTETRYAEVLNMKLPVKRFITISVKAWVNRI